MPLTHKGEVLKEALQEEYGAAKGESVLYAGQNKGTFTGMDNKPEEQPDPGPAVTAGPKGLTIADVNKLYRDKHQR